MGRYDPRTSLLFRAIQNSLQVYKSLRGKINCNNERDAIAKRLLDLLLRRLV